MPQVTQLQVAEPGLKDIQMQPNSGSYVLSHYLAVIGWLGSFWGITPCDWGLDYLRQSKAEKHKLD